MHIIKKDILWIWLKKKIMRVIWFEFTRFEIKLFALFPFVLELWPVFILNGIIILSIVFRLPGKRRRTWKTAHTNSKLVYWVVAAAAGGLEECAQFPPQTECCFVYTLVFVEFLVIWEKRTDEMAG
jgi:hypothetical protein